MPPTATVGPTILAALLTVTSAQAGLRSPHAPDSGTSLQDLLNAQGQTIDVAAQQLDVQGFAGLSVGSPGSLTFQVRAISGAAPALGLYNVAEASPTSFQVLPGGAPPGWYAAASFRTGPIRLVVDLFDAHSVIQASTTYLRADPFVGMGFSLSDAGGTFFSEDARNADRRAHMLVFRGTGAHSGDAWLCVESGSDFNYSDAVYLLEFFAPVPARHSSWGSLKQRFR